MMIWLRAKYREILSRGEVFFFWKKNMLKQLTWRVRCTIKLCLLLVNLMTLLINSLKHWKHVHGRSNTAYAHRITCIAQAGRTNYENTNIFDILHCWKKAFLSSFPLQTWHLERRTTTSAVNKTHKPDGWSKIKHIKNKWLTKLASGIMHHM